VDSARGSIEPDSEPPVDGPSRTEEQEVASGEAPETPAVALFSVIAAIAGLVLLALAIVGVAYWIAA
jgi:hypothetical protein